MRLNRIRPRIFFGWWIVTAVFVIAVYQGGAAIYGFTALMDPISTDQGWSYTQLSVAASMLGAELGLAAPLAGMLADRWGPRRVVLSGAIVSSIGFILFGNVHSLATFYAAYFILATGVSACTWGVLLTPVVNWFHKNAGLASGIAMSGVSLSGFMVPAIVKLIDLYGWRTTVILLGIGMAAVLIPCALVLRHTPEPYGYHPDGEEDSQVRSPRITDLSQPADINVSVKQALQGRVFWHMALAFTAHALLQSAVLTHIMPYLTSIGIVRSTAGILASIVPFMSGMSRIGLGWLGDRFSKRWVGTMAFTMMGIGVFCFGLSSLLATWLLIPFIIFFGIGYGGSHVQRIAMAREFFGRKNFGTIVGLVMGINTLGSLIGPPLAGWVFDSRGSFEGIWFWFTGFAFMGAVSILTIPRPRTPAQSVDKA